MFWRKKRDQTPDIVIQPPVASRVEVEVAKDANKETKRKADAVNSHVKDLLVENGITVKIVLAAHNPSARKKESRA